MAESHRMNISIPRDLRERMDQLPCNWSGVAAQAFREKIQRFFFVYARKELGQRAQGADCQP